MSVKSIVKQAVLAGAMTAAVTGFAVSAQAGETEKCYGVVKAGKNDCASASGSHSCAGHSSADAVGDEWVSVPKGLCEKLAGGSTSPKE